MLLFYLQRPHQAASNSRSASSDEREHEEYPHRAADILLQEAWRRGCVLTVEQANLFKLIHTWRERYAYSKHEAPEAIVSNIAILRLSQSENITTEEEMLRVIGDNFSSTIGSWKKPLLKLLILREGYFDPEQRFCYRCYKLGHTIGDCDEPFPKESRKAYYKLYPERKKILNRKTRKNFRENRKLKKSAT